jgi:nitroreductase
MNKGKTMKKPAVTQAPIHQLIAARWSGRAYDSARSITREQIIALLEAARWAPSCYGDQPWRFVMWNQNEDAAGWQAAFDCLAPGNQGWVKDAPLLLLVCADSLFNHNGQPNRWAQYDTGAAAVNLCLQAEALGMMAHQMGGFDPDKVRAVAGVTAQFTPMSMVAVGYPADPVTFSAEVHERETAPRKRRELGELFFAGAWGRPAA